MTLNHLNQAVPPSLLYVAEDESDTVDVIDLNPQDVGVPGQNQPATFDRVIENHPGDRAAGADGIVFADAIHRGQHQQRDALAG